MKIAQTINNPWLVAGVLLSGVWWLMENKPRLPDEIEPVTVAEQNAVILPLQDGDKRNQFNWAVRNIAVYWDRLCFSALTAERRNEIRTAVLEEYANHREARGVPHPYELMDDDAICDERKD